jgi:hypothetical protein
MPRPAGRAAHRLLAHPQRYSTRPSVRPHHSISSALATRPGPAHPSRGRLRRQPRCCQRIADGSAAERFWHAAAHRLVPRPSWPRPRGRPPPRDSPSGRRHLTAQASQPALIQTRARTFAMGGHVIGHGMFASTPSPTQSITQTESPAQSLTRPRKAAIPHTPWPVT